MKKKIGISYLAENNTKLLFFVLLSLGIIIRAVGLGIIPGGINQDEAFAAMDGWALSLYGTDHYGMSLPVHLTAWKYGQMSALLSYCMIPWIKMFGFNIISVRMPLLVFSCISIATMYGVGKELVSKNFGLAVMALTVINPWHFCQSRWSLDCNLFPHVFLIGFYLLLLGLRKKGYLYLSMVFFGLTFYCYGIAVYTVPAFLAVFAIWCLCRKVFKLRDVCVSVLIFGVVALPEVLVMAINFLGADTISFGPFTMGRFYESIRSNDILLLNFSFKQLGRNAWSLIQKVFIQTPDYYYNAIPLFGPLYHISIPFFCVGIVSTIRRFFTNKEPKLLALIGFWLTGVWAGLVTFEVNINRVNIIMFPMIIMTAVGISVVSERFAAVKPIMMGIYALLGTLFLVVYGVTVPKECHDYYNVDFLDAIEFADAQNTEMLYVSSDMGWQTNWQMAEILTQYKCNIDPLYYQGLTNRNDGKDLLPYEERYHFYDISYMVTLDIPEGAVVVCTQGNSVELDEALEILGEYGQFIVARVR